MDSKLIVGVVVALICYCCSTLFNRWRKLWEIETALRKQGIKGPQRSPLFGGIMPEAIKMRIFFRNKGMEDLHSHDILGRVLPEFSLYSKQYGVPYFFWWMQEPKLMINNPEHARELLSKQASSTEKSTDSKRLITFFLGHGLVSVDGDEWAHHRRVVSPAFHLEKLKAMSRAMVNCTSRMLDNWQLQLEQGCQEMEVGSQFTKLTSDIIAHTGFGSSYDKGKYFFHLQDTLGVLLLGSLNYDWIPFSRYVPNKHNRTIWRLQKEINKLLLALIQERRNSAKNGTASSFGEDLLGLLVAESENDGAFDDQSLIGECKTFYFVGQETTSSLLKWATYLLAINPEWQSRAREEVLSVSSTNQNWTTDMLAKLKIVGMILHETLRLYPPAIVMTRTCKKDIQMGNLVVPSGTSIDIPILAIHHDKELWGEDVHNFNPERFVNGVSRASKHPNAFMAFSFGPRICVGQAFALAESKIVLAMLLTRFSFGISPSYKHCPVSHLAIEPCHGLQITLKNV